MRKQIGAELINPPKLVHVACVFIISNILNQSTSVIFLINFGSIDQQIIACQVIDKSLCIKLKCLVIYVRNVYQSTISTLNLSDLSIAYPLNKVVSRGMLFILNIMFVTNIIPNYCCTYIINNIHHEFPKSFHIKGKDITYLKYIGYDNINTHVTCCTNLDETSY